MDLAETYATEAMPEPALRLAAVAASYQRTSMTLTPEQVEQRSHGIGASEIAAIVGVHPYRNALDVWLEKKGQAEPFEGNEFTHWGNILEPLILAEYGERLGVSIESGTGTMVHPANPWMLATPDGLALDADAVPTWGVECKNRNYFNSEAWGVPGTDDVPLEVAAQCQWSMGVTGLARWDAVVLLGGNRLGIYQLDRDDETIEILTEKGREFWFNHIQANVMPQLDGSASATAYLNRKYGIHGPDLRQPTPEILEFADQLKDVRRQVKGLDVDRKNFENQIKDFIGTYAGVQLSEKEVVTWKRPKPTIKTDWKMVADGLKKAVPSDVFDTLVSIHTAEIANTRRLHVPTSWGKDD